MGAETFMLHELISKLPFVLNPVLKVILYARWSVTI